MLTLNKLFKLWVLASALILSTLSPVSHAEIKKTLGEWDVHYIVFSSTFLTPEIAKANGIIRSKYNALVNISVLDKDTQVAQRIAIEGSARNLIGTNKALKFKRVIDGDAIYYLAPLAYRDQETYRFTITMQGNGDTQELTFQQRMYVDQ